MRPGRNARWLGDHDEALELCNTVRRLFRLGGFAAIRLGAAGADPSAELHCCSARAAARMRSHRGQAQRPMLRVSMMRSACAGGVACGMPCTAAHTVQRLAHVILRRRRRAGPATATSPPLSILVERLTRQRARWGSMGLPNRSEKHFESALRGFAAAHRPGRAHREMAATIDNP